MVYWYCKPGRHVPVCAHPARGAQAKSEGALLKNFSGALRRTDSAPSLLKPFRRHWLDPPWKTYDPHCKDRKKELGGSDFNPLWHDSVVIHETETTTVTFNMQNMTRIVNILHISGHVLSTRRDNHRFSYTYYSIHCQLSLRSCLVCP